MKTNTTTTTTKRDKVVTIVTIVSILSIVLLLFAGVTTTTMTKNKTYYIAPDGQVYDHNIDNSRQSIKLCTFTYENDTIYSIIVNQRQYTEKSYCSNNKLDVVTTYLNTYKLAQESMQVQDILCDWINN